MKMKEKIVTLTVQQMKEICSSCADEMEKKHISLLKFDLNNPRKYQMSPQAMEGLCNKFGDPTGFRTRCMDSTIDVDDKGAFCNWLKEQCHGSVSETSEEEEAKAYADLKDIKGVEIFAAGEWNGDKYTEEDLEKIVSSFENTKSILKPYLKLGHSKKQELLAKDELPAAGFIDKVYRKGKKLLADFVHIPSKIFELIKNKAYNRVSSEIFVNFKSDGKTYPYALKAVALLGGETPAVHTLNDILSLYSKNIGEKSSLEPEAEDLQAFEMELEPLSGEDSAEVNKEEEDIKMATLEELNRQNVKLEAEVNSLESEKAELEKEIEEAEKKLKEAEANLKEYKEKSESLEKKVKEIEKEKRNQEIEALVNSYNEKGSIVPAQKPFLIELLKGAVMNEETKVFSINGKEYVSIKDLVKAFIEAYTDEINVDEGKTRQGLSNLNDDAFVEKVKKYAETKKVSFKEALLELSASKNN